MQFCDCHMHAQSHLLIAITNASCHLGHDPILAYLSSMFVVQAITNHCFGVLKGMSGAQQGLLIDSIVWAFRHTERNVAETGLQLLADMLNRFMQVFSPHMSTTFYFGADSNSGRSMFGLLHAVAAIPCTCGWLLAHFACATDCFLPVALRDSLARASCRINTSWARSSRRTTSA